MDTASNVFANAFARMSDDELVDRWRQDSFVDDARPIAAAELRHCGVDPDKYVIPIDVALPKPVSNPEPVSNFASTDRPVHLRLFSFKGRASRTKLWLVVPASWFVFNLFWLNYYFNLRDVASVLLTFTLIGMLVPVAWLHWATVVQRLHDRNKSGNWAVILFAIPFLGAIWALVELGCFPGSPGPNRFGRR